MAHRHARRKGQVPQPSDKCIRRWRRLIKRAGGPGFVEAAEDAGRHAVAPVGHQQSADSPFMRLVRMGKDWANLTTGMRTALAPEARELAQRCAEILNAEGGGRERKDIDG